MCLTNLMIVWLIFSPVAGIIVGCLIHAGGRE